MKGIRKGVIGKWDALGQSIAMNGPAATLSIYLVAIIRNASYLTSVVLVTSFIIYSMMTYMVYQWSSETDSPAPWMVYVEKGLGKTAGFVAGWVYWLYYIIGFAGFSLLGLSSFVYNLQILQNLKWAWAIIILILGLQAILISLKKVEISTRYFLYAGIVEIIFILSSSLYLIIKFKENIPMLFNFKEGEISLVSIILGIGAFGGISGFTPLAGETKNFKKEIPSALLYSLIVIGATVIIGSIAQTLVMGSISIKSNTLDLGLLIYMKFLGFPFFISMIIFVINSFNSSLIATSNNFTRMMYGLSENSPNPNMIKEKVNQNGIPYLSLIIGVILGTTIAFIVGVVLTPTIGSIFLLIMAAIFSYTIHIMVSLSLMVKKIKSSSFSIIKHILIPIFVICFLIITIFWSIYVDSIYPYNYSVTISILYILSLILIFSIVEHNKHQL